MAFMDIAGAGRTATATRNGGLLARIGRIFTRIGEAQSRATEVERLNAKTDADLARMGLKREDIARHVFRDIIYL